ncbi:unnamed protein product [Angiostrongylus costaricensis]|uniref:CNX domain-containing protein n=1 Tax=Angiostrongylus costaricensis TaxID=334426 RepID=A0A0R3PC10_ANGCS|nr:unnamed protein product [Angiostrongylus costaricensis]
MTSLALFCLIALKIGWPQNYVAFVKKNELDSLQYFAKFTHETSELSCLWAGFRALYFALVALTLVKNITDYQVDAHHRQHNRYIYPPVPPYPRLVAIPEPVMGNTNPDDPPPYSQTPEKLQKKKRFRLVIQNVVAALRVLRALHQLNELPSKSGKAHVRRAEQ